MLGNVDEDLGNVDEDFGLFSLFIREWIHKAGGLFFVNGEGKGLEYLFEGVFNASWSMTECRRDTYYPGNSIGLLPNENSFRKAAPQLISVKACTVYAPPEDHIFCATPRNDCFNSDEKLCAMATTRAGKGAAIFFGDVDFESSTLNSLVALCLGYGHLPPCAFCHNQEEEGLPLLRCARCNMTHYCSVACQKKHWKKHKTVCSKDGLAHQEDNTWKAEVHLNVKIPPSVACDQMAEQHMEAMVTQQLTMDLHRMGCRRDEEGNFISPISGVKVTPYST